MGGRRVVLSRACKMAQISTSWEGPVRAVLKHEPQGSTRSVCFGPTRTEATALMNSEARLTPAHEGVNANPHAKTSNSNTSYLQTSRRQRASLTPLRVRHDRGQTRLGPDTMLPIDMDGWMRFVELRSGISSALASTSTL